MNEHMEQDTSWIRSFIEVFITLYDGVVPYWRCILIFIIIVSVGVLIAGPCARISPGSVRSGGKSARNKIRQNNKDRVKDLSRHPRTKSEALAVNILEKITGVSFPTVNPEWLRVRERIGANVQEHTIELDGYNADIGVALEFSGPLHTKWSPSIEPYKSYLRRVILDRAKIEICEKHGVCMIVIDMTLPRIHWRNYIASRLQDCGKLPADRAIYFTYTDKQVAVPYRDEILERNIIVDIKW